MSHTASLSWVLQVWFLLSVIAVVLISIGSFQQLISFTRNKQKQSLTEKTVKNICQGLQKYRSWPASSTLSLVLLFALQLCFFLRVRVFRRRYDFYNNERPFPQLDAELKSISDVQCQKIGVDKALLPCMQVWEYMLSVFLLSMILLLKCCFTWPSISKSHCESCLPNFNRSHHHLSTSFSTTSLASTEKVTNLPTFTTKKTPFCKSWLTCSHKSKRRKTFGLKNFLQIGILWMALLPAMLLILVPEEAWGGYSPAAHNPTQHYLEMGRCPSLNEVKERVLKTTTSDYKLNGDEGIMHVEEPLVVVSTTHIAAHGIIDRWSRARFELSQVQGAGMDIFAKIRHFM